MRLRDPLLLLTVAIFLVVGCVETKQTVKVNPDGSGQAVIDIVTASPMKMQDDSKGAAPDAQTMAKETVENILASAQGVDAWSDLSYDITKEGKVHLHVVAYFPDLDKFAIEPVPQMNWDRTTQTLKAADKKHKSPPRPKPAATPQSRQEQALTARMQYQQGRPMMVAMLTGLKIDLAYQLPGDVDTTVIFARSFANEVHVAFDGQKVINGMDKLVMDDAAVLDTVGQDKIDENPEVMYPAMFGTKGPLSAHVKGELKPQFDYAAEMKKAKDGQASMLNKLQLTIKAPDGAVHMAPSDE